jgi:hypothetical protein
MAVGSLGTVWLRALLPAQSAAEELVVSLVSSSLATFGLGAMTGEHEA